MAKKTKKTAPRGRPDLGRSVDLRVRVTADLRARIARAATREAVSGNELVIRALEAYLR